MMTRRKTAKSTMPDLPAKHKKRSRFEPKVQAGIRLEERDLKLLCDVFLHRLMSRGQIEKLYFSSTARCNVRLRQLFDHELLSRYYLPLAPYGAQCMYTLGKAGIVLVSRRLEWEPDEVARQTKRHKTPQFLEHTLAINEIRLALREALQNSPDWKLGRWISEIECRHEYDLRTLGGQWQREIFKPDGFVRLRHRFTNQTASFFLEVDMGHTSSTKFAEKLESHTRYGQSGLFREMFGEERFQTLVITTGPRRAKNLREIIERQNSSLFWFTTFDAVHEHGILSSIWQVPFGAALQRLP